MAFAILLFALLAISAGKANPVPGNVPKGSNEVNELTSTLAVSVTLDGLTFVNKARRFYVPIYLQVFRSSPDNLQGLVAFGLIPSDFKESTGDTLGGIGSAIALKSGSFNQNPDGTYSGTIVAQPDRGFNIDGTIDYQARQHSIDFVLSPYYGDTPLNFTAAQQTLQLTYRDTLLYTERNNVKTSGLDPLAIRPAQSNFPSVASADPPLPIPATTFSHLSVDAEGLVLNDDGTFWTSDEYGPYIYRFDSQGSLIQVIQPPAAVLPEDKKGNLNFTSETDPKTGRTGNQGFEGLTRDKTGNTLYAMLQSATIQDGGDDKTTSRYTRLFAYDISNPLVARPALLGEWVIPLPQSKKGKTRASSEVHFVRDNIFLVLARDGDGHGGDETESSYKRVPGSKFDDPKHPIADDGELDDSITPAQYVSFVDLIDDTQLARFGLHNGDPEDQTLIDAKWESIALAPVGDPQSPNDFFLFTAADNDFITTNGVALGVPYDQGLDNDNQFLVFRVTLPS
ncbi:hypothetical protein NLI96_g9767 [Meripilus lineatus]|uniref:Phytase-like domain-containing protein n=1 Tax=Meripilus lineatus TaxID=2056292 RepID=A0AAD5Y9V8_9APHY|nr:hypothetical protein NLI96_g9767 [Physisporinus lineatus]